MLAERPAQEIVAAARAVHALMSRSYLGLLWAAAYLISGGCSDDGFDYFRGLALAGWVVMAESMTQEFGQAGSPTRKAGATAAGPSRAARDGTAYQ